jgi:hypothetical protein
MIYNGFGRAGAVVRVRNACIVVSVRDAGPVVRVLPE